MIDPATLPQWKRTDRALAHRATARFLFWDSANCGTYKVGKNAKKAANKARVSAFRVAAVEAAASLGERAPKLKRYWKREAA